MLNTLVYLLVICVVIAIIWWVVDYLPVPQPLNKLLKVVSVVIGCIAIIYALLSMAHVPLPA
jgi:hypothetical protein